VETSKTRNRVMRAAVTALLAAVLVALSGYSLRVSATIPYAKETGKKCIYCHATTEPDASDLHWAGKYYAEKRTLKGYAPDAITAASQAVEGGPMAGEAPEGELNPRELRQVYLTKCTTCHGPKGKGTPGLKVPDFTASAWQASRTDAQIRDLIAHGRPPLMPAFAESVDEKTLDGLVKILRSFAPNKNEDKDSKPEP
jgi:mono/diheme cytochrome c family protein